MIIIKIADRGTKMLKKIIPLLFFALVIGCPARSWAVENPIEHRINIPVEKHVLDNGLTVLITEMPSSAMTGVYALVKTGSATEGEYLGTGISHFLEHLLFKGTEKRLVGE